MRSVSLAEGIVLRAYDPSDAGQLLVAVDGARDRLARWMPWVPFATTVQGFEDFIRVAIRQDRDGSGLHRGLFDSERLIGTVGASIG
jgi:RimJ/RimL family protein N-acetyltransferase